MQLVKVGLRPREVIDLIRAASPLLRPMLAFAAATGARPSEYLDLEWSAVDMEGGRVNLAPKGGGIRRYDTPPLAVMALEAQQPGVLLRHGPVFQACSGERYRDTQRSSGGQFATGWAGACRRAKLPGTGPGLRPQESQQRPVLRAVCAGSHALCPPA